MLERWAKKDEKEKNSKAIGEHLHMTLFKEMKQREFSHSLNSKTKFCTSRIQLQVGLDEATSFYEPRITNVQKDGLTHT